MGTQLKIKQDALCEKTREYDEALLKLINIRTKDAIIKTIKDYLSLNE